MPPYKKYYTECPAVNTKGKTQTRQHVKCPSTVQYECECATDDSQNTNGGACARRYIMVEQVDDSDSQTSEAACLMFSEQERLCKAEAEVRRLKKLLRQHQSQHQQDVAAMNECNCSPKPKPRRSQCCTCDCDNSCCKSWRPRCQAKPIVLCACPPRYPPTPAPEMWYNTPAQPYYDKYAYPQDMYIPQAQLPQDAYYSPSYTSARRYFPADMPPPPREPSIIQQPVPQGSFVRPQGSFMQPQAPFIAPGQQPSFIREPSFTTQSVIRTPSFAPQPSYASSSMPPFRQPSTSPSGMHTFAGPPSAVMVPDPSIARLQSSVMQNYTPSGIMPQMYSRSSVVPTPSFSMPVPSFARGPSYIQEPSFRTPSFIPESQMPAEVPGIDDGTFLRPPPSMQVQPSVLLAAPSFLTAQQTSQPFVNEEAPTVQRSFVQPSQASFRQPSSMSQARQASAMSQQPFVQQRSMTTRSQMSTQQMQSASGNAFPNPSFTDGGADMEDYLVPNDPRRSGSAMVAQEPSQQFDPDIQQEDLDATYMPSSTSQRSHNSAQRPMSAMSVGSRRGAKRTSYTAQLPPAPGEQEDFYQPIIQPSMGNVG